MSDLNRRRPEERADSDKRASTGVRVASTPEPPPQSKAAFQPNLVAGCISQDNPICPINPYLIHYAARD